MPRDDRGDNGGDESLGRQERTPGHVNLQNPDETPEVPPAPR